MNTNSFKSFRNFSCFTYYFINKFKVLLCFCFVFFVDKKQKKYFCKFIILNIFFHSIFITFGILCMRIAQANVPRLFVNEDCVNDNRHRRTKLFDFVLFLVCHHLPSLFCFLLHCVCHLQDIA